MIEHDKRNKCYEHQHKVLNHAVTMAQNRKQSHKIDCHKKELLEYLSIET